MNEPISKHTMLVIASALDALLSGVWFMASIGILAWQVTRADISE